jgi:hypothetical protein
MRKSTLISLAILKTACPSDNGKPLRRKPSRAMAEDPGTVYNMDIIHIFRNPTKVIFVVTVKAGE